MVNLGPLAGVSVVEAARSEPSALLGRLLGDLGAEVHPVAGEHAEAQGGFAGWVRSRDHAGLRWDDLGKVLARTDVLLCDRASSEQLAERDLGAADVLARFPQLITVRLSEFGMTGPLAGSPATELGLQELVGLTAATGAPDDPPITSTVGLASRTATLSGLLAVAAGLIGRARGAGGDYYDIAEFDSLMTHLGTVLSTVALTGRAPPRRGNRHGMTAPWNSYPCRDAHIMLCTMGDAMWERVAGAMGRPDIARDPRFVDTTSRVAHVDELDDIIAGWTRRCESADVVAMLRAARVPCAPIATPQDVRTSAAARDRQLVAGAERTPNSPLRSLTPTPPVSDLRPRQGGLWTPLAAGAHPMHGLRVLELGSFTAGPQAGRLLAQLGADVLKVEPLHGEGSRRLAQQVGSTGYLYFVNNAGKRSCRLDLSLRTDRARLDEQASTADVVVTNLAVDTMVAAGIAAGQILSRYNLVHCSVTGHGIESADRCFDTVIQAESGIMQVIGQSIGEPRRTPVSSVDVLGAYVAAAAVALASYVRLHTGNGQGCDVALFDAAAWTTQQFWFDGELGPEEGDLRTAAEPLHDLTGVVGHPQVEARDMLLEHRYDDHEVLITGNHLRSLRRTTRQPGLAPVDQNDPGWDDEAPTPTEGGR